MLLFLTPLLPVLLLCIPLHPMFLLPNDSTLYALLPMLLLHTSLLLIELLILLIPCFFSLRLCFLCFCFVSPYILCSCFQCFDSLCPAPFAPSPYVLAFDPVPFSPNSMLLLPSPLLPSYTSAWYPLASFVPASNASTLYALLPLLLLHTSLLLILLLILLIQCSCSYASAPYVLMLHILLHPMFLLPNVSTLFMPFSLCSYSIRPCF